ncbi:hypothetical protein TNCV_3868001 [Trichonephila clavipes]|nr:hypothetical protein TNCV_3868001 [Trichonephila clavipes]
MSTAIDSKEKKFDLATDGDTPQSATQTPPSTTKAETTMVRTTLAVTSKTTPIATAPPATYGVTSNSTTPCITTVSPPVSSQTKSLGIADKPVTDSTAPPAAPIQSVIKQ